MMDCNFAQTRAEKLDSHLETLNELLHLPRHKKSTGGNMIHDDHSYGGVLLEGYTDDESFTTTSIYGVNRTTDPKMTDIVMECISIIRYAKQHGGHI